MKLHRIFKKFKKYLFLSSMLTLNFIALCLIALLPLKAIVIEREALFITQKKNAIILEGIIP